MNINPPTRALRPDYGIDAPGVRRAMLLTGCIGLIMAVAPPLLGAGSIVATWMPAIGFVVAAHGLFMGSYTTYGSRIGKLRSREKLLDLAATLRPWTGEEILLDVGYGRGLMLLGAARRLTTGHAVGIDLWRDEDQAENSPVIHNLAEAADRRKALDEMLRVLRPHGVLVLADIANIREYRTYLASKGVTDM